jgi:RNA polymerase sigma factor (sigma-70 family)
VKTILHAVGVGDERVHRVDTIDLGTQLRTLYDQHYRSLVKLASFYLDDVWSCEEAVQDAFVALLAGRREVQRGREGAYLRSAVLNNARSALRKRQVRERKAPLVDVAPTPVDAEAVGRVATAEVLAAIRTLPHQQADVLVLRYFGDLSEAEIADTLGIARGTVKSHAHRGLARLAELLEAHR